MKHLHEVEVLLPHVTRALNRTVLNASPVPLPPTEQDQYDVREDVTCTETLL